MLLTQTRIVLVNTSHPGNIGAAARAMKTMGMEQLWLVAPNVFPHAKADEMASGAVDILKKAVVVSSLDEAIADCGLVVGTSARSRRIPWPLLSPRSFAKKASEEPSSTNIAVIFGREQSGLTNEELQRCHFHMQIPSDSAYSSLNIAAAVQVITYELRVASLIDVPFLNEECVFATEKETQGFYDHLEQVLKTIDFLDPNVPRKLMTRLIRLFHRARLEVVEVNILRGILGAIEKTVQKK